MISITRPGIFTTVQDLGRWGLQSRGVPVSGALDWYSHELANSLLGNDPAMATLEVTLVGPHLRFGTATRFAVAGAEFNLTLDDTTVSTNQPVEAASGAILRFGERVSGARAYVAVAGGVDVPLVLGSRSTHTLTRMGGYEGRALRAGDVLKKGSEGVFGSQRSKNPSRPLLLPGGGARLRAVPTDPKLFAELASQQLRVSPRSDRMGYRLEAAPIPDAPTGQMISTAMPTGAIQVPPTGQPILLMNDHATTGGYAIAGTVITADLPLAGQLAPGDWVEFDACSIEAALSALRERKAALGAE